MTKANKPARDVKNVPMFFERPAILDAKRHAKAGLVPSHDMAFAEGTNSIVINAVEFFEAAKYYPIVFTTGANPLPTAIVGLEKQNYFIDEKSEWKKGAYIPAYVRKYPFVFLDVSERNQFVLCVDEASPQYKEANGKDFIPFFKDGKPSDLSRNALEFCSSFHNQYQMTRRFCEDIKAAGLLTPMRSDAKLVSGRKIHLGGFEAIDEKKLQALPEKTIREFFKNGWLALIYAALMSSSNWKKLAELASTQEKRKAN